MQRTFGDGPCSTSRVERWCDERCRGGGRSIRGGRVGSELLKHEFRLELRHRVSHRCNHARALGLRLARGLTRSWRQSAAPFWQLLWVRVRVEGGAIRIEDALAELRSNVV